MERLTKNSDSLSGNEFDAAFPAVLARAGTAACFAADEFFRARISPPPDRLCPPSGTVPQLVRGGGAGVPTSHAGPGGSWMISPYKAPTKNQALAALRHFFDVLVARYAILHNPAHSVRGVRHPFGEGRTPEVNVKQARQLLASIEKEDVYGFRDRAVLGTLI